MCKVGRRCVCAEPPSFLWFQPNSGLIASRWFGSVQPTFLLHQNQYFKQGWGLGILIQGWIGYPVSGLAIRLGIRYPDIRPTFPCVKTNISNKGRNGYPVFYIFGIRHQISFSTNIRHTAIFLSVLSSATKPIFQTRGGYFNLGMDRTSGIFSISYIRNNTNAVAGCQAIQPNIRFLCKVSNSAFGCRISRWVSGYRYPD